MAAPGKRQGCLLSDISETGARIDIDEAEAVPERFLLWLSANGSARRICRVVWRKPHQIGVKFELRLAAADRASLVPRLIADSDADTDIDDAAAHTGAAALE